MIPIDSRSIRYEPIDVLMPARIVIVVEMEEALEKREWCHVNLPTCKKRLKTNSEFQIISIRKQNKETQRLLNESIVVRFSNLIDKRKREIARESGKRNEEN